MDIVNKEHSLDDEVQYFRFICSLMFYVIVRLSVNEYGAYEDGRKQNSFHLKQIYPSVVFLT